MPRVSKSPCKGVSLSTPIDKLPLLGEIADDYGTPSAYWQLCLEAYEQMKGANGHRPDLEDLRVGLLKATVEKNRREGELRLQEAARGERKLEEWQDEIEEKRASGAATERFASPDDVVRYWMPRLGDNAPDSPAWKNIAERSGFKVKDVRAAAGRLASQAQLPRRRA